MTWHDERRRGFLNPERMINASQTRYELVIQFSRRRRCDECRIEPVHDLFMLEDEIWGLIAGPRQFLCLLCAEYRLGRPLVSPDFTDAPCNEQYVAASHSSSNR